MTISSGFVEMARRQSGLLAARIVSRDNAHLAPLTLSRAAGKRFRAGLAHLQAYLRRLILCLALQTLPTLAVNQTPYAKYGRLKRQAGQAPRLSILPCGKDFPEASAGWHNVIRPRPGPVMTAPLLTRLRALKTLLDNPQARANRLALYLLRYQAGPVLVPGLAGQSFPARYGTELSAVFRGMGEAIWQAGRARPPPLGPRPCLGPRVRTL